MSYRRTRVYLDRDAWEMLPDDGVLLMRGCPTYRAAFALAFTKDELENVFGEVRATRSWDEARCYHFPQDPPAIRSFRVAHPPTSDGQPGFGGNGGDRASPPHFRRPLGAFVSAGRNPPPSDDAPKTPPRIIAVDVPATDVRISGPLETLPTSARLFEGRLPDPIRMLETNLMVGGTSLIGAIFNNTFLLHLSLVRRRTPLYPGFARYSRRHYSRAVKGAAATWRGNLSASTTTAALRWLGRSATAAPSPAERATPSVTSGGIPGIRLHTPPGGTSPTCRTGPECSPRTSTHIRSFKRPSGRPAGTFLFLQPCARGTRLRGRSRDEPR